MKKLLICGTVLWGVSGCGGETAQQGSGFHDKMCEMNPLAQSCGSSGVEATQGAVFGPPNFAKDWQANWGSYSCGDGTGTWQMGGRTHTYKNPNDVSQWVTRYEVVNVPYPYGANATLSVAPLMQLTRAMDGPYHILYNAGPWPYTENVCITTDIHPQCMLASIPPYGTWIYAPNERPDYPDGAQIITIDPQVPNPSLGACNQRIQFIVPI